MNSKTLNNNYYYDTGDRTNRITTTLWNNPQKQTEISMLRDNVGNITQMDYQLPTQAGSFPLFFTMGYGASSRGKTHLMETYRIGSGEQVSFQYTSTGQLQQESVLSPLGTTKLYTYDSLNQLKSFERVLYGGRQKHEFDYDLGGNIKQKREYATVNRRLVLKETKNYEYNSSQWNDQLSAYDGKQIAYDGIGNPISYNGYAYAWRNGRELAQISGSGLFAQYEYNASGTRVAKTVNGVRTEYRELDGAIQEIVSGSTTLTFIFAGSSCVGFEFDGHYYYYICSAFGDIEYIIDETGETVVQYFYDAWGMPIATIGIMAETIGKLNPYRYRGYIYDEESGLYYLSSRYYNPEWGRFISPDNIFNIGDQHGLNLYAYCYNNPINNFDPFGDRVAATFPTEEEAVKDFADKYLDYATGAAKDPLGSTQKREWGTAVYKFKDENNVTQYYYSKPVPGSLQGFYVSISLGVGGTAPPEEPKDIPVAAVHIHPNNPGSSASLADMELSITYADSKNPSKGAQYIVSSKGNIGYFPPEMIASTELRTEVATAAANKAAKQPYQNSFYAGVYIVSAYKKYNTYTYTLATPLYSGDMWWNANANAFSYVLPFVFY